MSCDAVNISSPVARSESSIVYGRNKAPVLRDCAIVRSEKRIRGGPRLSFQSWRNSGQKAIFRPSIHKCSEQPPFYAINLSPGFFSKRMQSSPLIAEFRRFGFSLDAPRANRAKLPFAFSRSTSIQAILAWLGQSPSVLLDCLSRLSTSLASKR
jgi:hypothetical protein